MFRHNHTYYGSSIGTNRYLLWSACFIIFCCILMLQFKTQSIIRACVLFGLFFFSSMSITNFQAFYRVNEFVFHAISLATPKSKKKCFSCCKRSGQWPSVLGIKSHIVCSMKLQREAENVDILRNTRNLNGWSAWSGRCTFFFTLKQIETWPHSPI